MKNSIILFIVYVADNITITYKIFLIITCVIVSLDRNSLSPDSTLAMCVIPTFKTFSEFSTSQFYSLIHEMNNNTFNIS